MYRSTVRRFVHTQTHPHTKTHTRCQAHSLTRTPHTPVDLHKHKHTHTRVTIAARWCSLQRQQLTIRRQKKKKYNDSKTVQWA